MADVLLFHHAQGLTAGCAAFAERVRAAGHTVRAPDLYDGRTFPSLAEGVAHAEQVGLGTLIGRGKQAAEGLAEGLVYVGFSLGVLPAQMLAQTRPGARGALLAHSCVPPSELGAWPDGLPAQIHLMEHDEHVLPPNEDLAAARELAATAAAVELFLYPGDRHLFADSSLPDYDEDAAALLEARVLGFLGALT